LIIILKIIGTIAMAIILAIILAITTMSLLMSALGLIPKGNQKEKKEQ